MNPNTFPIVLSLVVLTLVIVGLCLTRRAKPLDLATASAVPIQPRLRDNKVRNPRLLALMPSVEAVICSSRRSLTANEVCRALASRHWTRVSRKQVKACLVALVGNHHTVVRRESRRPNGRRGAYRYAPSAA